MKLANKIITILEATKKRYVGEIYDNDTGKRFFVRAEKSGGRWFIGGDVSRSFSGKTILIYSLDDSKIYTLNGSHLTFQDTISDSDKERIEKAYIENKREEEN